MSLPSPLPPHAKDFYVTARLACGHLTTSTVKTLFERKELFCWCCSQKIKGDALRPWTEFVSLSDGYNFKCQDCGYARSYGPEARLTCETFATTHSARKHHTVSLRLDTHVYDTVKSSQPELPLDGSPPF